MSLRNIQREHCPQCKSRDIEPSWGAEGYMQCNNCGKEWLDAIEVLKRKPTVRVGGPHPRNTTCDSCYGDYLKVGKIRKLNMGRDSNAYLCERCWKKEMKRRVLLNKSIHPTNRFPVLKFPSK